MTSIYHSPFLYLAPFVDCQNHYFHRAHFGKQIPLPFDGLPQIEWDDYEQWRPGDSPQSPHPQVLPPGGWQRAIGCLQCGLVGSYKGAEVYADAVGKASKGRYYSDAVCIYVEGQCGDERCRLPARWYVDIEGQTEADLKRLLRDNRFFGTIGCAHDIKTTPLTNLKFGRVINRLW